MNCCIFDKISAALSKTVSIKIRFMDNTCLCYTVYRPIFHKTLAVFAVFSNFFLILQTPNYNGRYTVREHRKNVPETPAARRNRSYPEAVRSPPASSSTQGHRSGRLKVRQKDGNWIRTPSQAGRYQPLPHQNPLPRQPVHHAVSGFP